MTYRYVPWLLSLLFLVVPVGPVKAGDTGPAIEKQRSIHALPMRVSVEQVAGTATRISGEMRRRSSSPSRRLSGLVRIEGIGESGQSLFVTHADLKRIGPSNRTVRARFSVGIENIQPTEISRLKIGYVVLANG